MVAGKDFENLASGDDAKVVFAFEYASVCSAHEPVAVGKQDSDSLHEYCLDIGAEPPE